MNFVRIVLREDAHVVGDGRQLCRDVPRDFDAQISTDDYLEWDSACDKCKKILEAFDDGPPTFDSFKEELSSLYGRSPEEIINDEGLVPEAVNHEYRSHATKFAALAGVPVSEVMELDESKSGDKVDLYCECGNKLWRDFHLADFVSVTMACGECGEVTKFDAQTYIPPRDAFEIEDNSSETLQRIIRDALVDAPRGIPVKLYDAGKGWLYHRTEPLEGETITLCGYPAETIVSVIDDGTLTVDECGNCGRTRIQRLKAKAG